MSKLVIVESPTKVKTVKKYLGDGYNVTASMGRPRPPGGKAERRCQEGFCPEICRYKGQGEACQRA